ncbi:helix-turn-helix domain-containing protein [Candidatus Saccharibacteria bacterium]|nr:helix-turn-helix domain-containing protein [Candidatus Saccharibacteria bacterium]
MNERERVNHPPRTHQTLANILKRRRESLDIALSEAETATRVRGKYLEAIEAGDYDALKDDVYSRGYVKNYADYLGLDTKPILRLYEQERAGQREMRRQSQRGRGVKLGVKPIKSMRWVVTPKTFALFSVLAVVGLVLAYIVWQVAVLSAPPKLSINSNELRTVTTNFGYVSGNVEGGADLTINDSPVLVSADGAFRERIALTDGRNEIKLTAKNKLGRSVTQTYIITARLAESPSPVAVPSVSPSPGESAAPTAGTTTDGVVAVVQITKSATWLIVEADGKEIFRGTMLANSSQTFAAAAKLKLSTGNAGVTQLVISNATVQNKNIGLLGAEGEVRRDIEFSRDTKL